jgi:hypothetical protein
MTDHWWYWKFWLDGNLLNSFQAQRGANYDAQGVVAYHQPSQRDWKHSPHESSRSYESIDPWRPPGGFSPSYLCWCPWLLLRYIINIQKAHGLVFNWSFRYTSNVHRDVTMFDISTSRWFQMPPWLVVLPLASCHPSRWPHHWGKASVGDPEIFSGIPKMEVLVELPRDPVSVLR